MTHTTPPPADEPLAERYNRLADEHQHLLHTRPQDRTAADHERLQALRRELRAIRAVPPDGYSLPTAAADLIAHAHAHGWLGEAQWTPPGRPGKPFVKVEVGRRVTETEGEHLRGPHWLYELTWHSRGCRPGQVRLFRQGLATTPDRPGVHTAPSVKQIRVVIAANPGPGGAGRD